MIRLLATLLLCAPGTAGDDVPKALQGRWTGARYTEGNGENQGNAQKLDFVFKDTSVSGFKESGAPVGEATFTVSADGTRIDCVGTGGGYRGKTYLGILKLEGDKLWWCTSGTAGKNQKRPSSFVANAGEASYLIVLTRVKN